MKSIWWTYCFFGFSSSRLYLIFMSTRIIFIIFLWKAKHTHTHTSHNTFVCFRCSVVHNLRLKLVASHLWLRLGHGGPTCAYLVWRDCLQCPRCSILQRCWWPPHPCPANPSGDMPWFEVILHGSRQPLQKLLTLTSIVSTRKTTCCGWANDGNWQLKHEAKRRLLGDLSFFCNWICWIIDYAYWTSLLVIFLSLELPWTMISTCSLHWRLSQPADKWSICIPHKPPKLSPS